MYSVLESLSPAKPLTDVLHQTLDTQGLLDPSDSSLDFVARRENVRPVTIYRIEEFFLLCYAGMLAGYFSNGCMLTLDFHRIRFLRQQDGVARAAPMGHPVGRCTDIVWYVSALQYSACGLPFYYSALHYPYILAFEPTFVEVRHVETGHLVQIIPGNHIRCLFADAPPSQIHTPQGPLIPYRNVTGGPPQAPLAGAYTQPQQGNIYGPSRPPPGPPPPRIRNQIIFVSDEGNVQVVRLAPPGPTPHRTSQSGSISRR